MKMTITEANRMVQQLRDDLAQLRATEDASMTFSHSEGEMAFPMEYNFHEMQEQMDQINEKILKVRHAVSQFNVETQVGETGMTVDSVLIKIAMLNEQKKKLDQMMQTQEVTRRSDYRAVEIIHRNFNIDEVRVYRAEVIKELNHLRAALDLTNLTKEIEVDF